MTLNFLQVFIKTYLRYGNVNFGDSGTVEDRREESITAMMMGMTPCEVNSTVFPKNISTFPCNLADGRAWKSSWPDPRQFNQQRRQPHMPTLRHLHRTSQRDPLRVRNLWEITSEGCLLCQLQGSAVPLPHPAHPHICQSLRGRTSWGHQDHCQGKQLR